MTNEQKAQRLEHLALVCVGEDAALLRESAAMWRERGAVQWVFNPRRETAYATHKGFALAAYESGYWSAIGPYRVFGD
jgi:hypothetical protein